jgi:hypothetical protein
MVAMRAKLICLLASVGLLSGCSPAKNTALALHPPYSPFTALLIADGISVINSSKTVEDHVISLITGENCSTLRAYHGYDYCTDDRPPPMEPKVTYCYKSLAKVSCYDRKVAIDEARYYGARLDMVPVNAP